MVSVVWLMSVPCNLYSLCCVLCATFTLVYIIVVSCMHVPLFMFISLCLSVSLSISLCLSVSLSEGTMVDEHCTAQQLHKFVCVHVFILYIRIVVLYPR